MLAIQTSRRARGLARSRGLVESRSFAFAAALGLALCVGSLLSGRIARAEGPVDWPQFRGAGGEGHVEGANVPLRWSETDAGSENIRWKTELPGKGYSSPVVSSGRAWLTTATDEGRSLRVLAIDVESGSILRDVEVFRVEPGAKHAKNSHASPSAVLADGRVFVHFGRHGTACLEADSGAVVWKRDDIRIDHEVGPGSSPVVHENLLVLTYDGTDRQFLTALDRRGGSTVWTTKRPNLEYKSGEARKAFCTPLILEAAGRLQLVSPGADNVFAYDPATGAEIWRVRYDGFSNVPRPVFGNGLVYVCTGFGKPDLLAIRPDGMGDVTGTHVAWTYRGQVPAKPSPLLLGESIYLFGDQGILTCVDAVEGKERWRKRLGGEFSASPFLASGRIYASNELGQTFVIEPNDDEYRELGVNPLPDPILASAAVIGDTILMRTETALYRIGAPAN